VGIHQLRRLGIKEPFENTKFQRFFRSFAAVNGTSGQIMDGNESQCQYQTGIARYSGTLQLRRLGIKEPFENTKIQRFFRSFAAVNGTSGRIMG
jgi:hypothetical protein